MRKIIIPIVLITNISQASDKKPIELINQAQGYVNKMTTEVTDPLCQTCSKELSFAQCVQDVCGKGTIHETYKDLGKKAYTDLSKQLNDPNIKLLYKDLNDQITKLLQSELDLYLDDFNVTRDLALGNKFGTDEFLAKLRAGYSMSFIEDEKALNRLPPTLREHSQKLSALFEKVVRSAYDTYAEEPDVYFKINHPNIDLKSAIQKELERFADLKKKLLAGSFGKIPSIEKHLNDFYKSDFYKNFSSNKDVDVSEASDLLETNNIMNVFYILGKDPEFEKIVKSIDLNDIKSFMHSDIIKNNINELDTQLKAFKSDPKKLIPYASYCTDNILSTYLSLPDNKIKQNLQMISTNLKEKLKQKVKLSEHTKKHLEPIINSWEFATVSREDFLDNVKYDIKETTRGNQNSLKIEQAQSMMDQINDNSVQFSFIEYSDDNDTYMLKEVFSIEDLCRKDLPGAIDDAAYTMLGRIKVSWGSLKNLDAGKAIMSHELGHKLSREMTKKDISTESSGIYTTTKLCSITKHRKKGKNEIPTIYAEEDFADTISAIMEGPEGNNFACFFPHSAVDTETKKEIDPLKDDPEDSHSSDFFRLLQVESTMRGELPPSCERYLEVSQADKNFGSCWAGVSK